MDSTKAKAIKLKITNFYLEVIKSLQLCGGGEGAPQGANDIRMETLWGNKFIQVRGKNIIP